MRNWIGWILVGLNLVIVDTVLVYWWRNPVKETIKTIERVEIREPTVAVATISPSVTVKPTIAVRAVTSSGGLAKRTVAYVPVPGSGSVLSQNWSDIAGSEFYFSPDDYLGLKEAYFEANFKLFNGNGMAFVRLFDVTAGVEVWGSEVQTASQSNVAVVSGKMTMRAGNHLYRVQAKSLTADTTVFNSGRIKLIVENK